MVCRKPIDKVELLRRASISTSNRELSSTMKTSSADCVLSMESANRTESFVYASCALNRTWLLRLLNWVIYKS